MNQQKGVTKMKTFEWMRGHTREERITNAIT